MKQRILKGVARGLITWLVYGVVEFGLTCVLLPFIKPELEFEGWQWGPVGMLFGTYAVFGLLAGAVAGTLLGFLDRPRRADDYQITVALTLVVTFVLQLILAWPLAGSEEIALAVAVLVGISLVVSLVSSPWQDRLAFLANPWVLAVMLLGVPWLSRDVLEERRTLVKEGLPIVLLAVVVALAIITHRRRSAPAASLSRQAASAAAVLGILGLIVLVSGRSQVAHAGQLAASPDASKPNILLITMDTVRADHLSVYGYETETVPNLGNFARQATVYDRAIAAADYTLPTHASIFTGLYPSWHGANLGRPLTPGFVTLAERLRSDGYRTMAAVANFGNLQPALGLNRGFSLYRWGRPVTLSDSNRPFYLRECAQRVLSLVFDVSRFRAVTFRAGDINRQAFDLLQQPQTGQPFFLFINYMDAHRPWNAPPPFNSKLSGNDSRLSLSEEEAIFPEVNNLERRLDPTQKKDILAKYDAGIAYMDSQIGRLLSRLRETSLYENTLIIITSDHGEAFGDHDLMAHNVGHVYQELVHVPLMIKYPREHEPARSQVLAAQVDFMPTVLDVIGLPPAPGAQGRSLRLAHADSDPVFAEAQVPASSVRTNQRFRGIRRAIFSGSSKLIAWTEGPTEFYDLAMDPNETHNLYGLQDPRAAALAERLNKWTKAIPVSSAPLGRLGKSAVERLKSLGYVQ